MSLLNVTVYKMSKAWINKIILIRLPTNKSKQLSGKLVIKQDVLDNS